MTFHDYWYGLPFDDRAEFARRLDSTVAHCIQMASGARLPSLTRAFDIRDLSAGHVTLDSWPYKRRALLLLEG